jgi:hypothetical protein
MKKLNFVFKSILNLVIKNVQMLINRLVSYTIFAILIKVIVNACTCIVKCWVITNRVNVLITHF